MTLEWPSLGRDLNSFGGDSNAYLDHCYGIYEADFYRSGSLPWPVPGQTLRLKRHPMEEDGRCNTFWHLISNGQDEATRVPDLRRCERISWPMEILREFKQTYPASSSGKIVWWKNSRGTSSRYVIALTDFSYILIIEDRKTYVLLWTGYPVEHKNRRGKMQQEFSNYWQQQGK